MRCDTLLDGVFGNFDFKMPFIILIRKREERENINLFRIQLKKLVAYGEQNDTKRL